MNKSKKKWPAQNEVVCGETIDHKIIVTYEDSEMRQLRCNRCGAEWEEQIEEQINE